MKKILAVALIMAAAVVSGQISNLLVNGSFESAYTGWSASGDQNIASNDSAHPASDGAAVVVLNPQNTGVAFSSNHCCQGSQWCSKVIVV